MSSRRDRHVKHAAEYGNQGIDLIADDTNVIVLCLSNSDQMGLPIFQKRGNQLCMRYINTSSISNAPIKSPFLLHYHAFYCDTASAFAGKGKLPALKILQSKEEYQTIFRSTQRAVLQNSCSTVGILLGKLIQFYVLLAR